MNNICFIPAKGNSKRLPQKNFLSICGKPMVVRAVEAAIESRCFNEIYVSSNDKEILRVAVEEGASILHREEELCADNIKAKDVLLFHLKEIGKKYDNVALLMPTTPLRTARHVQEAYDLFLMKQATTLVSVCEFKFNPGLANIIYDEKLKPYFGEERWNKRKDEFPKGYHLNGAIYLAKFDFFMQKATFLDNNTVPYIMERVNSVDVDTKEDLEIAKAFAKHFKINAADINVPNAR